MLCCFYIRLATLVRKEKVDHVSLKCNLVIPFNSHSVHTSQSVKGLGPKSKAVVRIVCTARKSIAKYKARRTTIRRI